MADLIQIFVFFTGISSLPFLLSFIKKFLVDDSQTPSLIIPQSIRILILVFFLIIGYILYFFAVLKIYQWLGKQGVISRRIYAPRTFEKYVFEKHEIGDHLTFFFFVIPGVLIWIVLFIVLFGDPFADTPDARVLLPYFFLGTLTITFLNGLLCYAAQEAASKQRI